MRKLKIDHGLRAALRIEFGRDVNYELHPRSNYLDLCTGRVTSVYESDEDARYDIGIAPEKNQEERLLVESDPDRFVLIPGLSHGDHHAILLDFLSSDWTDDEELRTEVRDAYSGSIGRWKKSMWEENGSDVVHAWDGYRDERIDEMIDEFLRKHGFEPE